MPPEMCLIVILQNVVKDGTPPPLHYKARLRIVAIHCCTMLQSLAIAHCCCALGMIWRFLSNTIKNNNKTKSRIYHVLNG